MSDQPIEDDDSPIEIDFSKGIRGLHHIPADAKVLLPTPTPSEIIDPPK